MRKAAIWILASLLVSSVLILGFNGTLADWIRHLWG